MRRRIPDEPHIVEERSSACNLLREFAAREQCVEQLRAFKQHRRVGAQIIRGRATEATERRGVDARRVPRAFAAERIIGAHTFATRRIVASRLGVRRETTAVGGGARRAAVLLRDHRDGVLIGVDAIDARATDGRKCAASDYHAIGARGKTDRIGVGVDAKFAARAANRTAQRHACAVEQKRGPRLGARGKREFHAHESIAVRVHDDHGINIDVGTSRLSGGGAEPSVCLLVGDEQVRRAAGGSIAGIVEALIALLRFVARIGNNHGHACCDANLFGEHDTSRVPIGVAAGHIDDAHAVAARDVRTRASGVWLEATARISAHPRRARAREPCVQRAGEIPRDIAAERVKRAHRKATCLVVTRGRRVREVARAVGRGAAVAIAQSVGEYDTSTVPISAATRGVGGAHVRTTFRVVASGRRVNEDARTGGEASLRVGTWRAREREQKCADHESQALR